MPYTSKEEIREKYKIGNDLSKIKAIPAKTQIEEQSDANPQRVAVYCRVSTDGISQVTSFELQKKYYIKYVRKHPGWKLMGLYSDEGISATTIKNRVGLQMMLRDAVEGKIDLIVIKSISRFCRNLGDSLQIIKMLKNLPNPVGIFFETENMSTLDPAMDLIIKVLSMVAEEESKKKSEAITAACRQRYAEGFFSVPPVLGYRRIGVNMIEIDEEEAETVRLIYDMYLAGFDAEYIAHTLMMLGRKKHRHVYADGRVKEGECKWNRDSVLQVFENEKRCGDVLAQKTYTYDCIEHIVRKNDNNVQMYYAVDQHPAIISREQLYLAQKIKKANKGGWSCGLQLIQIYYGGALKGFVRTVPNWYGYGYSEYVRASISVYGIDLPEDSIYPDYVNSSSQQKKDDSLDYCCESKEIQHLYVMSDDEFESDAEYTEEELNIFQEKPDQIAEAVIKLRREIQEKQTTLRKPTSARLFALTEKQVLTIDKNGISFSRTCKNLLSTEKIVIYYHPIYNIVLVKAASSDDLEGVKLTWCKDDKMRRCSAVGLCEALHVANNWDNRYKYRIIGRLIKIRGIRYIEFKLSDPIVRVPLKKQRDNMIEISEENLLDRILKEVVSTSELYSEIESIKETELVSKVESRSRAVYFDDLLSSQEKNICIKEHNEDMFSPEFISVLKSNGITPNEGWGYLDGMARFMPHYFDLFGKNWENRMGEMTEYVIDYDNDEEEDIRYVGWPTRFSFPLKDDVMRKIDTMRCNINTTC